MKPSDWWVVPLVSSASVMPALSRTQMVRAGEPVECVYAGTAWVKFVRSPVLIHPLFSQASSLT